MRFQKHVTSYMTWYVPESKSKAKKWYFIKSDGKFYRFSVDVEQLKACNQVSNNEVTEELSLPKMKFMGRSKLMTVGYRLK
ncbi:hypothetical protein [Aestuariirhabdus sp. LZHN29]|uniref:hypothetical protein n=1 Tax=Aestuariirhabdus sp. LZHN29 TaxID=3417462 RepID=UPI003CE6A9ED